VLATNKTPSSSTLATNSNNPHYPASIRLTL
jgi:hypothetical protein